MKLIRVGPPGRETPGVLLADGSRLDASAFGSDWDEAFFGGDGLDRLRAFLREKERTAPRLDAKARLGPPLRRPSKIICIGLNFRDHAAETGATLVAPRVVRRCRSPVSRGPPSASEALGRARRAWPCRRAGRVRHVAGSLAFGFVAQTGTRADGRSHSGFQWYQALPA